MEAGVQVGVDMTMYVSFCCKNTILKMDCKVLILEFHFDEVSCLFPSVLVCV